MEDVSLDKTLLAAILVCDQRLVTMTTSRDFPLKCTAFFFRNWNYLEPQYNDHYIPTLPETNYLYQNNAILIALTCIVLQFLLVKSTDRTTKQ